MNKKEIMEIKKQFTTEQCSITKMCGCYVNHEKEKESKFKENFLLLPEEETFKYLEIFRSVLKGTIGTSLHTLAIDKEEEPKKDFLGKLCKSGLKEEGLLDAFYDWIIAFLPYPENYVILLTHAVYDVPKKAADNTELFDSSENVYEHILCCICPVKLTEPGLAYFEKSGEIKKRERDWMIDNPINGFLYPAFNERMADTNKVLCYAKKETEIEDFVNILGCKNPVTLSTQKKWFHELLENQFGQSCALEDILKLQRGLGDVVDSETLDQEYGKAEIEKMLLKNIPDKKNLEGFEDNYDEVIGDNTISGFSLCEKSFEIQMQGIVIKADLTMQDVIRTEMVNGKKCIVIEMDPTVLVNGVQIKG